MIDWDFREDIDSHYVSTRSIHKHGMQTVYGFTRLRAFFLKKNFYAFAIAKAVILNVYIFASHTKR